MELYHLMLFWLQYQNSLKTSEMSPFIQTCIEELVLLLGHMCLLHPDNTALVCLGISNPFIKRLLGLPFEYFLQPSKQNILMPTLIILCMDSQDTNRLIVEDELSLKFLKMYIVSKKVINTDRRMDLIMRIPEKTLLDCLKLFD